MQRPPERPGPPILLTRPTYEWINRVKQKHKQFSELELTASQRDRLKEWVADQFARSALRVEAVAESETSDPAFVCSLEAMRIIGGLIEAGGRDVELTPELILRLGGQTGFRKTSGVGNRLLKPAPPEHLTATIEGACRWFTAPSFCELHAVEQASIVYLRIEEIQPFEQGNRRTALAAASLFTARSGLPPVIIPAAMMGAYEAARDEGFRMNTKPMVELMADAVLNALDQVMALVGQSK
jgi:Fic family protein